MRRTNNAKRLSLRRTTLRVLSRDRLSAVGGGSQGTDSGSVGCGSAGVVPDGGEKVRELDPGP